MPTKPNKARLILSELRGGDFTHPGDIDAINMMIAPIIKDYPDLINARCLDVGCGFGGTADYLFRYGFKNILGIDINKSSLEYAATRYKNINFLEVDATQVEQHLETGFSFIYCFSSLYAIPDKTRVFNQLAKIAKPGAVLAIFDYTITKNTSENILDLANKPMYPINITTIEDQLKQTGWQILEIKDISSKFTMWYESLLDKLAEQRQSLETRFTSEDIAKVLHTNTHILHQLKQKNLGGTMIYAHL